MPSSEDKLKGIYNKLLQRHTDDNLVQSRKEYHLSLSQTVRKNLVQVKNGVMRRHWNFGEEDDSTDEDSEDDGKSQFLNEDAKAKKAAKEAADKTERAKKLET